MKLDDILALEDDESIQYVSPTTSGSLTVKAGSTNTSATVMGVLPAYAKIVNQGVQSGRYIIDADVDNRSAVCVIGPDLAEDLFGNTNVVGNTLHIDGRKFNIVGVLESKGTSMGGSSDDTLVLPFTLAQRMLDSTTISSIYISAVDSASVDAAQEVVESFLYKKYQNDSTYSVMNQTQMLETANETASTLSLMLGGIAGISLLVGGIGIMNIMLVSVTERTREIGIRKAIGAKRRNILLQFLIESVVISGMGGLLGLALGLLLMRVLEDVLGMSLSDERGRGGTGNRVLDGGRRDFRSVSRRTRPASSSRLTRCTMTERRGGGTMEQKESAARRALRKKRARKRAIRLAGAAALAAALGALTACVILPGMDGGQGANEPQAQEQTATATLGTIEKTVFGSGEVQPASQPGVYAQTDGKIAEYLG